MIEAANGVAAPADTGNDRIRKAAFLLHQLVFDFFGNEKLESLSIKGNAITLESVLDRLEIGILSCDPITSEQYQKLPETMILFETQINSSVVLPSSMRNTRVEILPIMRSVFRSNLAANVLKTENLTCNEFYLTVEVQNDQAEILLKINDEENESVQNCMFDLKITISEQLEFSHLRVHNFGQDAHHREGDELDISEVMVEKVYKGGYSEFVEEFEILGDFILHEGENKFIVKADSVEEEVIVNVNYTQITCKTEELLDAIIKVVWEEDIKDIDREKKSIKISEIGMEMLNDCVLQIPSSAIWDLSSVKNIMKPCYIWIVYDGHKIDNDDLAMLEEFLEELPETEFGVINNTDDKNEDIIVGDTDREIEFTTDYKEFQFTDKNVMENVLKCVPEDQIVKIDYEKLCFKMDISQNEAFPEGDIEIASSTIQELSVTVDYFGFTKITLRYDGHKIDEKDLELLQKVYLAWGEEDEVPRLTIIKTTSDQEDTIVEQDYFEIIFVDKEPEDDTSKDEGSNGKKTDDNTEDEGTDATKADDNDSDAIRAEETTTTSDDDKVEETGTPSDADETEETSTASDTDGSEETPAPSDATAGEEVTEGALE